MSMSRVAHRQVEEVTARRQFLSQVGKAAITAPAVALLLAASARSASAQYRISEIENPEPRPEWTPVIRRRTRRRS